MRLITSATLIQEEENVLKYSTERMKKDKPSRSWAKLRNHNKDGRLSMLMKLRKSKLKVLTKTGDSISTDHSTLDQDFQ